MARINIEKFRIKANNQKGFPVVETNSIPPKVLELAMADTTIISDNLLTSIFPL